MTRMMTTLAALALFAGCKGEENPTGDDPADGVAVNGRITNQDGAQGRFAGSGTVAAATMVQSSTIGSNGALSAYAEADVDASGAFTVQAPEEGGWVLIEAVDAQGEVVGMVIVEPAEGERDATPIDSETSVEADVFLTLGADADAWARTRAYIDTQTAVAVRESSEAEADVEALAHGIAAATATEARAWSEAGVDFAAVTQARLDASAELSADLYAETSGAYATWLEAFDDAAVAQSADLREHAEVEAQASLAFRATVRAEEAYEVGDASASAVARAEARAWARLSEDLLATAGASQTILDAAADASASLEADIAAAGSVSAVAGAASSWRTELVGSTSVEGSLLGDALTVDAILEAALDAAVESAILAAAQIDATVDASAQAEASGPDFDADAVAQATVDAYASERAELNTLIEDSFAAVLFPELAASAEVVLIAHSGFRGL